MYLKSHFKDQNKPTPLQEAKADAAYLIAACISSDTSQEDHG